MKIKLSLLAAAAASILWLTPAPSSAQGVVVQGGPQVQQHTVIRRGGDSRVIVRERGQNSRTVIRRRPRRAIIRGERRCRTVVTRRVNRIGDTVVRRSRVCG
jgi:hypothetical protein